MDSFLIRSATGNGSLEFFERTPPEVGLPIERFKVRVTDLALSAIGRVYAGYAHEHPASWLAQLAADWRGWRGEAEWRSLEGEFGLRCAQDRTGHVFIRVTLCSGPGPGDWLVQSTIVAEAGQLEEIARQAALFFGQPAAPLVPAV